jgi:hypothetical protein
MPNYCSNFLHSSDTGGKNGSTIGPYSSTSTKLLQYCHSLRARGRLKRYAGRSWVRFPTSSLDFFSLTNPSSHTVALRFTQPQTEMITRNLPGSKALPVCRADNLTAIYELTV